MKYIPSMQVLKMSSILETLDTKGVLRFLIPNAIVVNVEITSACVSFCVGLTLNRSSTHIVEFNYSALSL